MASVRFFPVSRTSQAARSYDPIADDTGGTSDQVGSFPPRARIRHAAFPFAGRWRLHRQAARTSVVVDETNRATTIRVSLGERLSTIPAPRRSPALPIGPFFFKSGSHCAGEGRIDRRAWSSSLSAVRLTYVTFSWPSLRLLTLPGSGSVTSTRQTFSLLVFVRVRGWPALAPSLGRRRSCRQNAASNATSPCTRQTW